MTSICHIQRNELAFPFRLNVSWSCSYFSFYFRTKCNSNWHRNERRIALISKYNGNMVLKGLRDRNTGLRGWNKDLRDRNKDLRDWNKCLRDRNTGLRGRNYGLRDRIRCLKDRNMGLGDRNKGLRGRNWGLRDQNMGLRGRNKRLRTEMGC